MWLYVDDGYAKKEKMMLLQQKVNERERKMIEGGKKQMSENEMWKRVKTRTGNSERGELNMQGVESDKKPKGGRHQHVVMYIWTWIKVGWDEGERRVHQKSWSLSAIPTNDLSFCSHIHTRHLPFANKQKAYSNHPMFCYFFTSYHDNGNEPSQRFTTLSSLDIHTSKANVEQCLKIRVRAVHTHTCV